MHAFEQQLREAGYLAMGGQIVDATLAPAPKQRNTEHETAAIKAGKSARQIWRGKSHISIDHRFGFIRKAAVTSVAESDERQFRRVIAPATPPPMSGLTAPIAAARTKRGGRPTCSKAASIAGGPRASLCPRA
jgi:hypothetical protein